MLNYDETLILFGRSPFILQIKDFIPLLCERYHTMGCNYFCESFKEVENVIFYDDLVPKVQPYHRIITNIDYYNNELSNCYSLLHNHQNKELYKIFRAYDFSKKPDTLHMCMHTPSLALNWAWLKGFKNIVLAGIDLNIDIKEHFDSEQNCTLNQSAMRLARYHIEKVAQNFLNIYQLNIESTIKIPKLEISKLVN